MVNDLFDTSTVPLWRTVGSVNVADRTRILLGDPCYGALTQVRNVLLGAGEWVWEIRDADADGKPVHRVWEVRLRRDDTVCEADWVWADEYGNTADVPTVGAQVDESRGVDAGRMAWQLAGPHTNAALLDTEALMSFGIEGVPQSDGRVLVTSSGWGDGGYPVGVRRAGGVVVEVRMAFISPEPGPLTLESFLELLPGAFIDPLSTSGPAPEASSIELHMTRTSYPSEEQGNPDVLSTDTYDALNVVVLPEAGLTYANWAQYSQEESDEQDLYLAPNIVSAVATLWRRLPAEAQAVLTATTQVGVSVEGRTGGAVAQRTTTPIVLTLVAAAHS